MSSFLRILTILLLNGSLALTNDHNPSIIIVGTGPSGIAAATRLLKNNFSNLVILEAENRIGGRINSVKFGNGYVDLGAEFCHGEGDNIVYSLIKDLGILQQQDSQVLAYTSTGESVPKAVTEEIIQLKESLEATDKPPNDCDNVRSIGDCLDIRFKSLEKSGITTKGSQTVINSRDWVNNELCLLDAPFDLNDLNITTAYKKCPGKYFYSWNGYGYKTILEVMMQKYPKPDTQLPIDDKIFLQNEVVKVTNWQEGKVNVKVQNGTIYKADHVIFTPSLGVLKATYKSLFNPPLPTDKIQAIENIGFGAVAKIVLHFPKRWWNNDDDWILMWTPEDKNKLTKEKLDWLTALTGKLPARNNPNVIIFWFCGKYVPEIEGLSENEIQRGINYFLNSFFSSSFNVTHPDKILRSNWYSNSHFRGIISYESVKGYLAAGSRLPEKLAAPLLRNDNSPSILFAGEATHPYYFSTVHGAIETGYREADRLRNLYKNDYSI